MQLILDGFVSAVGENVVKVYDKTDGRHWIAERVLRVIPHLLWIGLGLKTATLWREEEMEWLEFGRAKTIHLVVRYWMDIGFENTQQDCGVLEVRYVGDGGCTHPHQSCHLIFLCGALGYLLYSVQSSRYLFVCFM